MNIAMTPDSIRYHLIEVEMGGVGALAVHTKKVTG